MLKLKKRILIWGFVLLLAASVGTTAAQDLTPMEQLGKSIFFDQQLSIEQDQSCATCHGPAVGFTGPESVINDHGAVYEGSIDGRFGDRKPPSATYATPSPIFYAYIVDNKDPLFIGGNFWDGRATGEKLGNPAADQAQGPFLNPVEQALPDSACVVYRVCNPAVPDDYPVSFEEVWTGVCEIDWPDGIDTTCTTEGETVSLATEDRAKSDIAYDDIALSIAAYEASPGVNAFTSKYDYSLIDMTKLSQEERKGFALFQGKGMCKKCHTSSGNKPLFTDFTFDNLGIPQNPENPAGMKPNFVDQGLGGFLKLTEWAQYASINDGKHKVPTLRNVAKGSCETEPDNPDCIVKAFGHNGYFKTLKGIVHFYNTRDVRAVCPGPYTEAEAIANNCWPAPEVSDNVNTEELGNLGLTSEEEDKIVAFLTTLSDGYTSE